MRKDLIRVPLIICAFLFLFSLTSCGVPEPKKVPFVGKWRLFLQTIASNEERFVNISTDGERFRIEDDASIQIYDGTYLYSKTKGEYLESMGYGMELGDEFLGAFESEISKAQSDQLRFWVHYQGGKAGPGGQIAGRETVLYQTRAVRPDGEITVQNWVDAETGIVLKSVNTIFAKQIGEVLTKDLKECTEINYAQVEEDLFSKPE